MFTPNYESDSNSSSSSNDSLSLTKQLLDEPLRDDTSFIEMTRDVVQTSAIHISTIISTMLMKKKCPHGGSTLGRRYIRRDRKERHDLIINDYFNGEDLKYTLEHFSTSLSDGYGIIPTNFTSN
ncbi:Uncharacterized protein Adt_24648 [Abeliophyllum distichum]|uniref:Uncharacterized protein n=1 Tax=Abeliophyllum distichum TaxID=126358 RepID=A0ABD1SED5_9LAMI